MKKAQLSAAQLLTFSLIALLTSCVATMDNPKASSITVNEQLAFGDGVLLKRYTLQPGVFPYTRTTREGHLYQSPVPGTLRDTGIPFKQEGGILWRHQQPKPDRLYRKTLIGLPAFMLAPGLIEKSTINPGPPPVVNFSKAP